MLPFHRTTELPTKFEPVTFKEKGGAPTGAQVGSREVTVGTGLEPLVTLKLSAFEVPPPGAELVTVTATVPAEAMAAAGTGTINCVVLRPMLVIKAVPKLTVAAAWRFVPVIVSEKGAPPTMELLGEIAVIAGIGLTKGAREPHPERNGAETMAQSTMKSGPKTSN
jgi:hypothetical protein